jgi:hypothetical protein
MLHLIVSWFVSALALWLVAQIVPGIWSPRLRRGADRHHRDRHRQCHHRAGAQVSDLSLTFLTLGLFLLVVNAFLLKLASLVYAGLRGPRLLVRRGGFAGADHPHRHSASHRVPARARVDSSPMEHAVEALAPTTPAELAEALRRPPRAGAPSRSPAIPASAGWPGPSSPPMPPSPPPRCDA